jgi:tetratricopeptide (TPR) repeat protein
MRSATACRKFGAMTMAPSPVESGLAQAVSAVNAGRRGQARTVCEQLLVLSPGHPGVHQLLALIALDEGDAMAAERHAEASLASRAGHAPTLALAAKAAFARALAAHARGDPAQEEAALRRALAHVPQMVEAEVNLAIVLQSRGALEAAMAHYGRAFVRRPDAFGRIAHALASEPRGAVWLDADALRAALREAATRPPA